MKQEIIKKIPADLNAIPNPTCNIVVCSGSWYEMGKQYVQQCKNELLLRSTEMLGDFITIFGSYEKVISVIAGYLEATKNEAPQVVDLLNGMSEELGLASEVCAMLLYGKSMIRVEMEACSHSASWGSATENGHMICGANVDMDTTTTNYIPAVLAFPEDGNAYICGENFHRNGLNEKGLVTLVSGGQNCGSDGSKKAPDRHMWNDANIVSLAYSNNVREALEGYKRWKYVVGCNQFLGDDSHDACIIEFTAGKFCIRRSGDYGEKDFLCATNGYLAPELQASLATGPMYWDDCLPRYWSIEKILHDNYGQINLDVVESAHGSYEYYIPKGWSYVKHEGWDGIGEWVKGDIAPYPHGWHSDRELKTAQWSHNRMVSLFVF